MRRHPTPALGDPSMPRRRDCVLAHHCKVGVDALRTQEHLEVGRADHSDVDVLGELTAPTVDVTGPHEVVHAVHDSEALSFALRRSSEHWVAPFTYKGRARLGRSYRPIVHGWPGFSPSLCSPLRMLTDNLKTRW